MNYAWYRSDLNYPLASQLAIRQGDFTLYRLSGLNGNSISKHIISVSDQSDNKKTKVIPQSDKCTHIFHGTKSTTTSEVEAY